jgi:predicted aconitase with swiveling domain
MNRTFCGRPVIAGKAQGEAVVTKQGFNTLSVYYKTMVDNAERAIANDQDNPDTFGLDLTDKIICLPVSIGSTSAGATWDRIAQMGLAPKAMLFSGQIDSLAAAGLVLADIWVGCRVVTVDGLGSEFLETVKTGQFIRVLEDGGVVID